MKKENVTRFSSVSHPFAWKWIICLSLTIFFTGSFMLLSPDYRGAYKLHVVDDRGDPREPDNIRTASESNIECEVKKVKHGCYVIKQDIPSPRFIPMKSSELARLGCSKREPSAILIGTKKSGTTTLKNFLSYHPDIAFADRELRLLKDHAKSPLVNLDDYRAMMPYSTPNQVPMEKTPGYFTCLLSAQRLQRQLPNTKLIVILHDPIQRAISDFVHMRFVIERDGYSTEVMNGLKRQNVPRYEIEDSFSKSVLFSNGTIKAYNSLIDVGVYVKYFRQWLQYFPLEQFLILDGEPFVRDPVPALRKVEDFLGVGRYSTEDHFYYSESKHFYCMKKPLCTCMSQHKGRSHPHINDRVIEKLTQYYKPYNRELEVLLNRTFAWS